MWLRKHKKALKHKRAWLTNYETKVYLLCRPCKYPCIGFYYVPVQGADDKLGQSLWQHSKQ